MRAIKAITSILADAFFSPVVLKQIFNLLQIDGSRKNSRVIMQGSIHHLDSVCLANVRHMSCVWVSSSGTSSQRELDGLWIGLQVTRRFQQSE